MQGWEIREGDALERLADMPDESVQCCVTSPPYFGLRDYGIDGQIGLERSPDEFVARLVEVFREVRRVLRSDGTLWLNIGDSYASVPGMQGSNGVMATRTVAQVRDNKTRHGDVRRPPGVHGVKPKDLLGIPWLLAFALRADGWYLRSDVIWAKPNPMPESVTDRPTSAHEHVFLLAKSARYFYDADAIREPNALHGASDEGYLRNASLRPVNGATSATGAYRMGSVENGRNKRNVWEVITQPYAGAHFATFPPKLIEPCILAGSAAGDVILDPFAGAGTTGLVALRHDRSFVGIELNQSYAEMARERIRQDAPLLNTPAELAA